MNLTKTSAVARKLIIGGIVIVILAIITKVILIPTGKQIAKSLFPPKNPPNPIYGKLDSPVFESKEVLSTEISYELDTKTGKLPSDMPEKMTVYRIEPPAFSYEGGKKAFETAKYLGFSDTDLVSDLKKDTYVWRSNSLGRDLTIQIYTKDLSLSTETGNKSGYYFSNPSFNETSAINSAVSLLTSIERGLGALYKAETPKVRFGKYSGQRIVDTDNPSTAHIAMVDFYRKIKLIPIYGPDPDKGLISVVVGNTNTPSLKYVSADIKNYEINPQSNATYPIVPVSQVWSAIKNNEGVIASVNPQEQSDFEKYSPVRIDKVLISNIELAYFESNDQQKYLQPIYVFKGFYSSSGSKGSIVIYYPAISAKYIKEVSSEQQ